MADLKIISGKAQAKTEYNQFKTAVAVLKGVWAGFTNNDKNNALTNLSTGWAGATAGQKADALRVAVCLLSIIVAYLAHKVLDDA